MCNTVQLLESPSYSAFSVPTGGLKFLSLSLQLLVDFISSKELKELNVIARVRRFTEVPVMLSEVFLSKFTWRERDRVQMADSDVFKLSRHFILAKDFSNFFFSCSTSITHKSAFFPYN